MKVTRQYIMQHRTNKGSWTWAQMEALGLSRKRPKGWIDRVIGIELTPHDQWLFESKMNANEYRRYKKGNDMREKQGNLI